MSFLMEEHVPSKELISFDQMRLMHEIEDPLWQDRRESE